MHTSQRISLTNTTVPDPAAEHVRRFCRALNPTARPVVVPIHPQEGCEALDCFNNVRRLTQQGGGRIQYGWAVWEWPRVFIEAEHHAVFDIGDGSPWVDVTPANDGETTRFFLPDDGATYDFENEGIRRDNVRQALSNDPNIRAFFEAAEAISKIMNSIPGVGEVKIPVAVAREIQRLEMTKVRLMFQIGMKHTGRNDLCFCRSGLKFKKCHGSPSGAPS